MHYCGLGLYVVSQGQGRDMTGVRTGESKDYIEQCVRQKETFGIHVKWFSWERARRKGMQIPYLLLCKKPVF